MTLIALTVTALINPLVSGGSALSAGVNHQTTLASGESKSIAAQLVPVRGYSYVDVSKGELATYLAGYKPVLGKNVQAVSFHSIVAKDRSQNTAGTQSGGRETGFLQLVELFPNSAPPVGKESVFLRLLAFHSVKPTSAQGRPALTVSGQKVLVYENASHPDSRFLYMWYRDGVASLFYGATRSATEKWIRAYLSQKVLDNGGSSALSARLTTTPGYAYVNMTSDFLVKQRVRAPLGAEPYSLRAVVDTKGAVGALLLAQVSPKTTLSSSVAKLKKYAFKGFTASTTRAAGPLVWLFASAKESEDAMVSIENGVVQIFIVDPAQTTTFESASDFYFQFL